MSVNIKTFENKIKKVFSNNSQEDIVVEMFINNLRTALEGRKGITSKNLKEKVLNLLNGDWKNICIESFRQAILDKVPKEFEIE